jgi:hypothetical protein
VTSTIPRGHAATLSSVVKTARRRRRQGHVDGRPAQPGAQRVQHDQQDREHAENTVTREGEIGQIEERCAHRAAQHQHDGEDPGHTDDQDDGQAACRQALWQLDLPAPER